MRITKHESINLDNVRAAAFPEDMHCLNIEFDIDHIYTFQVNEYGKKFLDGIKAKIDAYFEAKENAVMNKRELIKLKEGSSSMGDNGNYYRCIYKNFCPDILEDEE